MRLAAFGLTVVMASIGACGVDRESPSADPTSPSPAPADSGDGTAEASLEPAPPIAGELFRCDTVLFPLGILLRPGIAEQAADPAAEALRRLIGSTAADGMLPASGWRRLGATANITEFASEVHVQGVMEGYVSARFNWNGVRWEAFRWGGCNPRRAAADGFDSLVWWLPNGRPDPATAVLTTLVVVYQCQAGPPADAILRPAIDVSDRTLTIDLTGRGAQDGDCPHGQPTPFDIVLPHLLGDRQLLDGSQFPARDPTIAPNWLGVLGG